MRRRTIVAFVAFASLLAAGAADSGQSSSSPSSSSSSPPKATTHKHKHYAKHQPPGQKAPTPDRISEIQSALAREGYYQGDPNGKLDSSTLAALEKFQSANGLDSTGKLDASTLQKLGLGSDIAGVGAPKPIVPSCCSARPAGSGPASTPALSCCSSSSAPPPQAPAGTTSPNAVPSDPKPDQK
jgi:Putative peptidoglycan binding domain